MTASTRRRSGVLWPAFLAAVAVLAAPEAATREVDGRLGLIQSPHNGAPALVLQGGSFSAKLRRETPLHLRGADGAEHPLAVEWRSLPADGHEGACTVPESVPPGAYTLVAGAGEDRNYRAVFVYDQFPDYYPVAHAAGIRLGSDGHGARVLEAVAASDARLVFLTGNLTSDGTPEAFRAFLALMDTLPQPTFVSPGPADRTAGAYEDFFGESVRHFAFGPDGYLLPDTSSSRALDDGALQVGTLKRYRRALKPQRWTVAFTHRYGPAFGMRAQMVLLIDDPVDGIFFQQAAGDTVPQLASPWGATRLFAAPLAAEGFYSIVDMTHAAIMPRSVLRVTEAEAPDDSP